jgi:uncharacterized protein (TIGR03067 family)
MLVTKLRTIATLLLVATLLGGGGSLLAHWSPAGEPKEPPRDGRPAAPGDEKAKTDKELLQATWVEESRGDGEKVPEGDRWKLVFEGDKATWRSKGKEHQGTFTLDPTRTPKEIDLNLADPTLTLNGIYELKGDTLKTLWRENDREGLPKTFDPKEGVLIVLKKMK